jgi:hypothetical protein
MTHASWWISSFLAFFLTFGAVQTQAATVTPAGITNLQVGTEFYDVTFFAGSCVLAFDGCNDLEDIAFPGSEALSEAMISLSAVLNTGFSFPAFHPNGCSDGTDTCLILTPSSLDRIGSIFIPDIRLTWDNLNNRWVNGSGAFIPSLEYNRVSFAVWSQSAPIAPVPLPAGALLLSSGLVGLWALRRRKHKNI